MKTRSTMVLALLVALLMPASVPAVQEKKAELPDTPAGRTVSEWIEAVNSGDRERMRAFHLKHSRGTEEDKKRAERISGMDYEGYTRGGGFTLVAVDKATDAEIQAEVETKNGGNRFVVWFKVETDPPYVITGGTVRPAGM